MMLYDIVHEDGSGDSNARLYKSLRSAVALNTNWDNHKYAYDRHGKRYDQSEQIPAGRLTQAGRQLVERHGFTVVDEK